MTEQIYTFELRLMVQGEGFDEAHFRHALCAALAAMIDEGDGTPFDSETAICSFSVTTTGADHD